MIFFSVVYRSTLKRQRCGHCIWSGYTVPICPNKGFWGFTCPALAHLGRCLMYLFSIRFVVSLLSQLKHILGLADQRAHALTFGCVRLCSEGKISNKDERWQLVFLNSKKE